MGWGQNSNREQSLELEPDIRTQPSTMNTYPTRIGIRTSGGWRAVVWGNFERCDDTFWKMWDVLVYLSLQDGKVEQRDTLSTSKEMRPVLSAVNILRNTALHYYLEGSWLCRELKTCCWLGHQLSHGETMEKKNKMTRSLNATPPGHPRKQWGWIWNELEFLYFVEMNESIRSASLLLTNGLPWWLRWWRVCLQCGRTRFNPWVGKIPWKGHGNPLQYSCLKNPHGQRSLAGYSQWSCKEPDTTKQLSIHTMVVQWLNSPSSTGGVGWILG